MVRDLYNSVQQFENALNRLEEDESLPKHNREIVLEYIKQKKVELLEGYTDEELKVQRIRSAKTLHKYVMILGNICKWFPDLRKIDEAELRDFKLKFYSGQLVTRTNKTKFYRPDYEKKVIKSDFFKYFLGYRDLVEKVFTGKTKGETNTVSFIEIEDLRKIVDQITVMHGKVAMWVMFSTGLRIGTYLQLKKKDFELKYNNDTKVYYYLIHISKDITKSKADRTIPVVIDECNDLLRRYLEPMRDEHFLSEVSYNAVLKMLKVATENAGVVTKPKGEAMHPHILRKSATLHLLNAGYSVDQVKMMLGHKPSSKVIDVYLNYSGLDMKPIIDKVQSADVDKLRKELENTKMQMNAQQQLMDKMSSQMDLLRKQIIDEAYNEIMAKIKV